MPIMYVHNDNKHNFIFLKIWTVGLNKATSA